MQCYIHLCKGKNKIMPLFIQEHTTSRMVVTSEAKKRKVFVQEETEGSFKGILDTLFLKVLDLLFSIIFV